MDQDKSDMAANKSSTTTNQQKLREKFWVALALIGLGLLNISVKIRRTQCSVLVKYWLIF